MTCIPSGISFAAMYAAFLSTPNTPSFPFLGPAYSIRTFGPEDPVSLFYHPPTFL
jgi:hypothetical protein